MNFKFFENTKASKVILFLCNKIGFNSDYISNRGFEETIEFYHKELNLKNSIIMIAGLFLRFET